MIPRLVALFAVLVGSALVVYGAWTIYEPLGPIMLGAMLIGGGLVVELPERSAE